MRALIVGLVLLLASACENPVYRDSRGIVGESVWTVENRSELPLVLHMVPRYRDETWVSTPVTVLAGQTVEVYRRRWVEMPHAPETYARCVWISLVDGGAVFVSSDIAEIWRTAEFGNYRFVITADILDVSGHPVPCEGILSNSRLQRTSAGDEAWWCSLAAESPMVSAGRAVSALALAAEPVRQEQGHGAMDRWNHTGRCPVPTCWMSGLAVAESVARGRLDGAQWHAGAAGH